MVNGKAVFHEPLCICHSSHMKRHTLCRVNEALILNNIVCLRNINFFVIFFYSLTHGDQIFFIAMTI